MEDWLFPSPPAGPSAQSTLNKALSSLGYLAATGLAAGAAVLRQTGEPAWATMWAEDGRVFYSQALSLPFARTLVSPHAGYVQLYPRLIASIATLCPPQDASTVMALAGALSLGALSSLVFFMAKGHVPSWPARLLLACSMPLLPIASGELLDNAVNVPWWLFFACFWALLWRPATHAGAALAFFLCALAGASEPLTAIFFPLAALRVVALSRTARKEPSSSAPAYLVEKSSSTQNGHATGKDRVGQYAPVAGLVGGLVSQLSVVLANGRGSGAGTTFAPLKLGPLLRALGTRVGLGLLAGTKGTDWLASHYPGPAAAAGFVLICLVAAAGVLCPLARARAFTLVAVTGALVCFVLEAWARGIAPVLSAQSVQSSGRYQSVPLLLLLSSLVVSAGAWVQARARAQGPAHLRRRRRGEILATAICAALLLPTWVVDFRNPNPRSRGPLWAAGVEQARARCRARGTEVALVPIDPPGWTAPLPCTALAGATHAGANEPAPNIKNR